MCHSTLVGLMISVNTYRSCYVGTKKKSMETVDTHRRMFDTANMNFSNEKTTTIPVVCGHQSDNENELSRLGIERIFKT